MSRAFAGRRVVVAGLGVSGRAAVRVLVDEGAEVRVTEEKSLEAIRSGGSGGTRAAGPSGPVVPPTVEILTGGHRPEHLEGAGLLVVSPGIRERAPIVAWAGRAGIPVWSELELGARLCRVPYVAVTGTNGKSTTVEMIAAILRSAGLRAAACGNVGHPFSLAAREPHEALVVEASSFQLRFTETLHPRVSVLLNLAPDHLDWHGSMQAYLDAKARIYVLQGAGDAHVGNRDDHEAARLSGRAPCPVRWFGGEPPRDPDDSGVAGDHVIVRGEDVGGPAGATRTVLLDAAASAAAASAFGISLEAIRKGLSGFRSLPHRGGEVARAGTIRFFDDSKATNPHAALAALEGRTGAVLIAGGLAKGVDLSPLATAAPGLAAVVAIGEAAPAVAAAFAGLVPVRSAGSMEEAVAMAFEAARSTGRPTDVVLAPACASQDMFRDYRERGDRFAAAARDISGNEPDHVIGSTRPDPVWRANAR